MLGKNINKTVIQMKNKWHAEDIYNQDKYFHNSDGAENWRNGQLKYGDALCAICYALGIDSFEEVQKIYNFQDYGQYMQGQHAKEQIDEVIKYQTRAPKHILEIGAGRGEVSHALSSFLGVKTTSIEPNKNFIKLLEKTSEFFQLPYDSSNLKIINKDIISAVSAVDWETIDTIIFVESLEHILEEDFDLVYPFILNSLQKNNGRLIITNWIHYHPLNVGQGASKEEHCRLIDDELYDNFSKDAKKVIYRNNSHLVLEF